MTNIVGAWAPVVEHIITFSSELDKFAPAFIRAQGNMDAVLKSAENPAFKSRYADLHDVCEAVGPALQHQGIAVIQAPGGDGELVSVETMLLHESGQFVRSTLRVRPVKGDPQAAGSAITYARRYALLAMTCRAPVNDDDDGAAASAGRRQEPARPPAGPPPRPSISPAALKAQYLVRYPTGDFVKWLVDNVGLDPAAKRISEQQKNRAKELLDELEAAEDPDEAYGLAVSRGAPAAPRLATALREGVQRAIEREREREREAGGPTA